MSKCQTANVYYCYLVTHKLPRKVCKELIMSMCTIVQFKFMLNFSQYYERNITIVAKSNLKKKIAKQSENWINVLASV